MNYPNIPKNPVTIGINSLITNSYFKRFIAKYLPAFDVTETSSYRNPKKNKLVGGAEYSSHQYALAKDFILRQDGTVIDSTRAKSVFDEYIKPNWPGFALFEVDENGKYHVHVNLSRNISIYTGVAAGVGLLGAGLYFLKKKRII